jgi:hypothetical protein
MKTFKLDNEQKIEPGFKVPDHYFDTFSAKMMQQLEQNDPPVISIFQRKKTLIFSAVAAVLVLALMVPLVVQQQNNKENELETAALENYITYQTNVNQYDLINGLNYEEIENMKTPIALEDEAIEEHFSTNTNLENLILE